MDRDKLRAAVEANIITADQAKRMEESFRSPGDGEGENESLRFLSNLNDIFLSVGMVLLFLGLIAAASILSFGAVTYKHLTATICIPLAVIAWALSEYFCARRRMLLPSIVLASLFTLFVGVAAFALSAWIQIEGTTTNALNGFSQGQGTIEDTARALSSDTRSSLLITCGASFLAAFLFYLRFRLPFTMMLMAINVTSAAFLIAFGYETLLLCGVLCLLAAIAFDARDPRRTTRISDNGFWLHVAAAPQLVYGLRGLLDLQGTSGSMAMVSLLAGLAVLSILLNRRALILSGLISFGFAVWSLFQVFGDSALMKIAGPLLFLGGLIVLLGGGWRTARRILLLPFPSTGIWSRIFPPEPRLNV